jgi:hypothetical protein
MIEVGNAQYAVTTISVTMTGIGGETKRSKSANANNRERAMSTRVITG